MSCIVSCEYQVATCSVVISKFTDEQKTIYFMNKSRISRGNFSPFQHVIDSASLQTCDRCRPICLDKSQFTSFIFVFDQ